VTLMLRLCMSEDEQVFLIGPRMHNSEQREIHFAATVCKNIQHWL